MPHSNLQRPAFWFKPPTIAVEWLSLSICTKAFFEVPDYE